jgi:hypothetical protein
MSAILKAGNLSLDKDDEMRPERHTINTPLFSPAYIQEMG